MSTRLAKALLDFNETRASDVFVVNFGGHYHYPPGNNEDEKFKAQVFPVLDALAELGEKATVVWRCDSSLCLSPPLPPSLSLSLLFGVSFLAHAGRADASLARPMDSIVFSKLKKIHGPTFSPGG